MAVFPGVQAEAFDPRVTPVPFAPDIAIEVLSPSQTAIDVNRKTLDYLAGGTREVWVLDTENGEVFIQTESAIRLLRGSQVLDSPLLPEFSVPVSELLSFL